MEENMGKWMDLAIQLEREVAGEVGLDNSDNSDVSTPNVAIVANVHASPSLSPDIVAGLDKLRTMRCPRIQRPDLWDEISADALRIATEGWATQAIALGWESLQVFGYQPSDDPDDFSLAVELAGRSIVAVDESRFYLRRGDVRSFFDRRARPLLARYLWDFDQ